MINDFKAFLVRGNVVDLAVAVVIGAAFGKIVSTFVEGIVMPFVSLLSGGTDFTQWFIPLDGSSYSTLAEATEAGAAVLQLGVVLNSIIDFVLVGFAVFMMVKVYERMQKKEEEAAGPSSEDLLTEIRDLLQKR